jgi:hypothetical protein
MLTKPAMRNNPAPTPDQILRWAGRTELATPDSSPATARTSVATPSDEDVPALLIVPKGELAVTHGKRQPIANNAPAPMRIAGPAESF